MEHSPTPRSLYPKLAHFCEQLVAGVTPVWLPVRPASGARAMDCFSVVEARVRAHGGQSVTGWQLWEWPPFYLEAEFHAVWRSPNGQLIDLTPKEIPVHTILFLEDPTRPYGGRRRRNEMCALSGNPVIGDFIEACNEAESIVDLGDRALQTGPIKMTSLEKVRYGELMQQKQRALFHLQRMEGPRKADFCWCGSRKAYKVCHY